MTNFRIEKSSQQTTDTMVVIFFFHGARERVMKKYCNEYHSYSFDVMCVPSYLKTFVRPTKSKKLARKVLSFLKASCASYSRIIIHAFSMGAYHFSVCMREMTINPELYSNLQDKIKAVIYDSLTINCLGNLARMSGKAVFRNKILATSTRLTMSMYFCLTHPWTVRFYRECEELFEQKPLNVPTLLFTCKNDRMCQYDFILEMIKNWRVRDNVEVDIQVWDDSEHCGHLRRHENDYRNALSAFINGVPGH